ncbi:MAG: cell division protein FtsZ [Micavibrio sp.]|nr:cell division protein FtsZ [Micavibrio sp.]
MINISMQPASAKALSPKIAVIGVGGAGGNAVNNMIASNLEGCEFIVCNTDAQAIDKSLAMTKIQLGEHTTGGLGAGSKPEVGKAAAEETIEEVMRHLDGANMAFITAGMGGGTGTGAAPVIAKACRERGILTVGVVTKPFHFEGSHRMKSAERGIEEIQDYVDTLIVIPNQNLFRIANEKTTFADAFQMADSVLQAGVRGVTDLMVRPGLVNLDFADIRTAMMEQGKAMMGTGEAEGEKRSIEAAEAAINNPLLDDVSMKGAHGVIINVTGGYDMTLFEADEACNRIRDEVDPEANIIFGATFDEALDGKMRVSIVATGIQKEAMLERQRNNQSTDAGVADKPVTTSPFAGNGPVFMSAKDVQEIKAPAKSAAPVDAKPTPAEQIMARQQSMKPQAPMDANPPAETPADMFEQGEFADMDQNSGEEAVARNTALRGMRYNDSFIPPRPAEAAPAYISSFTGAHVPEAEMASAGASKLTLNPPKQPQPQAAQNRRAPSLFERITGSVSERLGELSDQLGSRPAVSQPQRQRMAPAASSQGSLNIDSSSKPAAGDEQLDIPAFLRRQAN